MKTPHDGRSRLLREIEDALREHPAVADVSIEERPSFDGWLRTVTVVPDALAAPEVCCACSVEAEIGAKGLSLYEPDESLLVVQKNRSETDFLFSEIWRSNAYLRSGFVLPRRATIVDVGANIGMFSLFAASLCEDARIVAVEPIMELGEATAYNAAIHGADVTVINAAVGEALGDTAFTYYPNNTVMSSRVADLDDDVRSLEAYITTHGAADDSAVLRNLVGNRLQGERRRCRVVTISSIVDDLQLERIDVLKIDVEKAELDAIAGISEQTWPKIQQIVLEVHDIDGRVAYVQGLLREHGFRVHQEREPSLVNTDCFTVYGSRTPIEPLSQLNEASTSTKRSAWPSRKAISAKLLTLLKERFPAETLLLRFEFCSEIGKPSGSEHAEAATQRDRSPNAARIESELTSIWKDLFGDRSIDSSSNFFEIGGNSLAAVRLVSRIEKRFGAGVLPLERLFGDGSFAGIVDAIDASLSPERAAALPGA